MPDNRTTKLTNNPLYFIFFSFSSFNMGAALGLGYDITPNFGINARYVAGFTDINKKDSNTNGNTSLQNDGNKNRNNTFQAGVYYKF